MHRIKAGDAAALLTLLEGLRGRRSTISGFPATVICCFEAGRDGFWLHRLLTAHDIPTHVVESTSILVSRRAKRAKTDRLDAEGLLRVLAAYLAGDTQICRMVRVPTPEEEDGKRVHRERDISCRNERASKIASSRFLPPKESADVHRCERGRKTWQS
jgi:transposase